MRGVVFVFVAAVIVGAQAGCEWYKNCGACVADSGCGWCSNDPTGVGSGSIGSSTSDAGKAFKSVQNDGAAGTVGNGNRVSGTRAENGVDANWLVNVRGQYENIATAAAASATFEKHLDFEGTGYVASPYFGQTWGGVDRKKHLVGLHKTKFTTELKAQYTVTPYTKGTYTVSSVQSDTQATMKNPWTSTFSNIEFQIGNMPCSGTISYPDTSKEDVYGSWPPNPTKFTTELKDGYTIACKEGTGACGGTNVRITKVYNDQHLSVSPRFTRSFAEKAFVIEMGPRGVGLISGTATASSLQGSDPCRTHGSPPEPCYENTRFLTELRKDDVISIHSNQTGTLQERAVAYIQDNAHLTLTLPLSSMLNTKSKFKIKTFHSSPFTYARKATGGLSYQGGTSTVVLGYNSSTFTKNLMAGYAIIAKVPGVGWEKRTVVTIDSQTSLTIDSPFTAAHGNFNDGPDAPAQSYYNYESCPSLTYENFDLRTENGHGVITSDGTNHVYDNVQYSKITTTDLSAANVKDRAAKFSRHLKVGYTITMDGITRTVTKIVSNTLLHVDRAFKEGVQHMDYSYRYAVRKTGDYHLHWKPQSQNGDYHETTTPTDLQTFSRSLIASPLMPDGTTAVLKQQKYLQYPPVCYNTGRCVPKSSHSLVGVESALEDVQVLSSTLPHQTAVLDYVKVTASAQYFSNCKPVCTVTVASATLAASLAAAVWETRRVITNVNSTFIKTELPFSKIPASSGAAQYQGRVRYVTGTGTVKAQAGNTVTGASKETKTKFNSEFASGWTISIGCGGATCAGSTCANDGDCAISGKVTGGKCVATVCTAETKNITAVSSDTQLTTSQAFINSYTKVDYSIGMIPGLGYITNSQNSKIIDGTTGTRFLEQLKVGYTITSMTQTRTITAIASNKLMTVNTAFDTPGITAITSFKFSGKKGTGEVTVAHASLPKVVVGTTDVTQTQFQNELALGYMFMLGNDYKVVTRIISNTKLEVDTPFTKIPATAYGSIAKWGNDYNYESCWMSMGDEAAIKGTHATLPGVGWDSNGASPPVYSQNAPNLGAAYTNKKVYVEDACEIKPGCCGFKVSSVVYPDRFAYYKIRPPHTNMNIRVVVKTTEDNVDLVIKKSAVPTTASYDYKSVRESNPWALTVPQEKITCGTWAGVNYKYTPSNCDYWYIGVRGDNRYPQKTGASEYDLYVYTEFDWPNFLCSDAHTQLDTGVADASSSNRCKWLGVMKNEDANMVTNDDSQAVMRLTPNVNQAKGSMYYSTKVHLYDGFETTFQFRMTGFSVGCNSVLYPSGFCGGGDGFAFVIQKTNDQQTGCAGSGLGYASVMAAKQGNDWARHRCMTSSSPASTCDQNDDGIFNEVCVVGALCKHIGDGDSTNGGCGVSGQCGFQDCTAGIQMVLAVEFDTWNNLKLHDPKQGVSRWWINATEFVGYNDNHVAIFSSNSKMESDHALNAHFAATPSIPNLADGKNHTVKIKYWPTLIDWGKELDGDYNRTNLKKRGAQHTAALATTGDCEDTNTPSKYPAPDDCFRSELRNNKPGNFAVFIDDMKRPVLQTAISLRKSIGIDAALCHDNDRDRCVLDELGNAYIGFTASTGGERAGGRYSTTDTAVEQYTKTADVSTAAKNSVTANEDAKKMLGAAQYHEILSWKFCNQIGCVPI